MQYANVKTTKLHFFVEKSKFHVAALPNASGAIDCHTRQLEIEAPPMGTHGRCGSNDGKLEKTFFWPDIFQNRRVLTRIRDRYRIRPLPQDQAQRTPPHESEHPTLEHVQCPNSEAISHSR